MDKMFDGLKGIGKEKEIVKQDDNAVAKLINFIETQLKSPPDSFWREKNKIEKRLDFDYDTKDIRDVLVYYEGSINEHCSPINFNDISGVLLNNLYNRHSKGNEKSRIEYNGKNIKHKCSFWELENFDELIIRNCDANLLCQDFGAGQSHIDTIAFIGNNSNNLCSNGWEASRDGSYKSIGTMIVNKNRSLNFLGCFRGNIELLFATDNYFEDMGACLGIEGNITIDNLVLIKNSFKHVGLFGRYAKINNIISDKNYFNNKLKEKKIRRIRRTDQWMRDVGYQVLRLAKTIDYENTEDMLSKTYEIKKMLEDKKDQYEQI